MLGLCAQTAQATQAAPTNKTRIYRCIRPNAPPLFSGTACNSAQPVEPAIINAYTPPALTPSEQQQLLQLNQRLDRRTIRRKSVAKSKQAKVSKDANKSGTKACARHQEALRALQNRRRKGYKLSEAARLDNQEQRLRQDIRLHC